MQKRHFELPAVMQDITVNRGLSGFRGADSFPGDLARLWRNVRVFAYTPIPNATVLVSVVFLGECTRVPGSVFSVKLADHIHQRSGIAVIEQDLPSSSAPQGFAAQFLYRRKAVSPRHLIKMVEKV